MLDSAKCLFCYMTTLTTSSRVKQFGIFELDLQRVELRKQGVKVKLQEQPLKILQLLLEHPGEIISRKELRSHIWPEDTFVEFDQGLYSAMARLRDALGDTSESPRYIETVARRGYRFIAQVRLMGWAANSEPLAESQQEEAERKTVTLRRLAASMVAGLIGGALLLAIVLIFDVAGAREWLRARTTPIRSIQPRVLSDKDTIVLGDFANSTGDPVFDGAMRAGLSVELEQSPFLSLLSDEGIHQTLRMMGQSASARLTPEIAREVCQRTNSTAALGGSIALIGTRYDLIEQPSAVSDSSKICQLHPKPRVRNRSTTPNARRVRVRHIKRQTDCLDGELRKARQDLASIGLLVQPARELRRIPAPYRSELLGLSS